MLAGVAIKATQWSLLTQQLSAIKTDYGIQDKEIHAGWLARRYVEQEKIPGFENMTHLERRAAVLREREISLRLAATVKSDQVFRNKAKNYKKTNDYIHLSLTERRRLLSRIGEAVGGWPEVRLFGEAIRKASCRHGQDPFEEAFTQVISRFEAMLANFRSLGIIIQDNNETEAARLTRLMKSFHDRGTKWRGIDHIVETPLFVDSQLTEMIQVADVCSYATRRFFENGEADLFNQFYPRFDRIGSRLVGLRHYTGRDACACCVCRDHRTSVQENP